MTNELPRSRAIYESARHVGISADAIERFLGTLKMCGYEVGAISPEGGAPRGGLWNVGDQEQPDGYVVLQFDAGSAPRGYWLAYAYTDRSIADQIAAKVKGHVEPIYFGAEGRQ